MKRSEVVDKLQEYLLNNIEEIGKTKGYNLAARELLDLIEEEGMLPPMILGKNNRPKIKRDPYVDFTIREWEKEDE